MDGFFFEISKGATVAGNVFVNCDKGIRALNSSNVRAYQNTLVNAVASFERTPRSAVGDHFGWHPATGPDVDARHGHAFVGNLLVGDEGFRRPLLNVEQSPQLCGKLTDSPLTEVDGNVYVRRGDTTGHPLITWSPTAGPSCTAQLASPADLTALHATFETHSRAVSGYAGALFRSPELRRYELAAPLPATVTVDPVPDAVRKLLGWLPDATRLPGAYSRRPVTAPVTIR
jgi:parallel beta-helix repeat protein